MIFNDKYYFCIRCHLWHKEMSEVVEPDKQNANLTKSPRRKKGTDETE